MIHPTRILLMASLSLIMSVQVYAVPRYHVIPIVNGHANGINAKGDVVGETAIIGDYLHAVYPITILSGGHAFLYKNVMFNKYTYIDLGVYSTGHPLFDEFKITEGIAVNNSDTVVGAIVDGLPQSGTRELDAFIWSNGKITDIAQGSDDGGYSAYATSINNKGDVVGVLDIQTFLAKDPGYQGTGYGEAQAFLYRNGVITPLGTLNNTQSYTYSVANGINNAGQIVGWEYSESNGTISTHGFLWMNGQMRAIGSSSVVPNAINDNGWIVGYKFTPPFEAVLYIYGLTIKLGLGEAVSINNGGTVVGNTFATGSYPSTGGFIYVIGKRYDLNTLVDGGWKITEVGQINDAGQIAATGTLGTSTDTFALLLTPVQQ
jgi:probable HAF family extracellular repeat protein